MRFATTTLTQRTTQRTSFGAAGSPPHVSVKLAVVYEPKPCGGSSATRARSSHVAEAPGPARAAPAARPAGAAAPADRTQTRASASCKRVSPAAPRCSSSRGRPCNEAARPPIGAQSPAASSPCATPTRGQKHRLQRPRPQPRGRLRAWGCAASRRTTRTGRRPCCCTRLPLRRACRRRGSRREGNCTPSGRQANTSVARRHPGRVRGLQRSRFASGNEFWQQQTKGRFSSRAGYSG